MIQASLIREEIWRSLKNNNDRTTLLTQVLMVTVLLGLTLFHDAIQQYLQKNFEQLLGADMLIESHTPLQPAQYQTLSQSAVSVSNTTLTTIVITHQGKFSRVQLKQVDQSYPVEGKLKVSETLAGDAVAINHGPDKGDIWVDARLATSLGVKVGDSLQVADTALIIRHILRFEPDRLLEGHNVEKRAMIHTESLPAQLLKEGKFHYRYLLDVATSQQTALATWVAEQLPTATLHKKQGGQHPLSHFWQRTENFIGLSAVLLFFLAAVALDMGNRRWLEYNQYRLSVYLSFGTPLKIGLSLIVLTWISRFLISLILGGILAILLNLGIMDYLQQTFPNIHLHWQGLSTLKAITLLFALLLMLQLPAFIRLRKASLVALLRKTPEKHSVWIRFIANILGLGLLAAVYSDNPWLTTLTLLAMLAAITITLCLSTMIITAGDYVGRNKSGFFAFTFFMLKQRLFSKTAQIMGLGLCALLVLFSLMLMRDLGSTLSTYQRTHDGNLLITDATDTHLAALKHWAVKNGADIRQLRPFIHAQVTHINGKSLQATIANPSDSASRLKRPIRLSWSDKIPNNNRLVNGEWSHRSISSTEDVKRYQASEGKKHWQQVSVESEVMTDLGLKLGDRLTFHLGSHAKTISSVELTIAASHAYQPGAGSVTFWFQAPAALQSMITSPRAMGSMELPDTAWSRLDELLVAHPTLSVLPLQEVTQTFDRTLDLVVKVILGFAALILLFALLVIAATIQGFQVNEQQKNGLLMSMGISQWGCVRLAAYEWLTTAGIAMIGAIFGTVVAGVLMYQSQFGLVYQPDMFWLLGVTGGMLAVVCGLGVLSGRASLRMTVPRLMADIY